MATNVYRYQITKEKSEINRLLLAAMLNESIIFRILKLNYMNMVLSKYFQIFFRSCRFCFRNINKTAWSKAKIRLGRFVETKAVAHYAELLEHVEWDDETRATIEKTRLMKTFIFPDGQLCLKEFLKVRFLVFLSN